MYKNLALNIKLSNNHDLLFFSSKKKRVRERKKGEIFQKGTSLKIPSQKI